MCPEWREKSAPIVELLCMFVNEVFMKIRDPVVMEMSEEFVIVKLVKEELYDAKEPTPMLRKESAKEDVNARFERIW